MTRQGSGGRLASGTPLRGVLAAGVREQLGAVRGFLDTWSVGVQADPLWLVGFGPWPWHAAARLVWEVRWTIKHGVCLGLEAGEAQEVLTAWSIMARGRGMPLPWGRVRGAMTARALGNDWRPR